MTTDITAADVAAGPLDPSVRTWLHLSRVFQKIDHRLEDLCRKHGLSVAQLDVLARVDSREGMTQQELANCLLVTKGNICQLLDRMGRSGLLERRQEGRANRLFLTERGKELVREYLPRRDEAVAGLFSTMTCPERDELLRLLGKMDQSLQ